MPPEVELMKILRDTPETKTSTGEVFETIKLIIDRPEFRIPPSDSTL